MKLKKNKKKTGTHPGKKELATDFIWQDGCVDEFFKYNLGSLWVVVEVEFCTRTHSAPRWANQTQKTFIQTSQ